MPSVDMMEDKINLKFAIEQRFATEQDAAPSELQLFLHELCLMGVVEGSSTPLNRQGPGASSTHFPFSWLDKETCMGL